MSRIPWRNPIDEGVATMGVEWTNGGPAISNGGVPRIPHPETEYDTAAARRAAEHAGDLQTEAERAARIREQDETKARTALEEFLQRVKAWDELGGRQTGSAQQRDELANLAGLLTVAQGRGDIMRARLRDGTGLYKEGGR